MLRWQDWSGRWWFWGVAILLLLTLMALFSAGQMYLGQIVTDRPIRWSLALRRCFEDWYSLGVLLPAVMMLSSRMPLERRTLRRWLGVHAVASILYTLGSMAIFAWVLHGQTSIEGTVFVFGVVYQKLFFHYSPAIVVLYWIVVSAHQGWNLYAAFREREMRSMALERELVQARLQALRMQLNPHFLFNALHTISALVRDDPRLAERTIARLSDLLRRTLDPSDRNEIPLRDEITFLSRYLDIEKARFGDRLAVELDVPHELEEAAVPPMILQPLVENAVRHGIERAEVGGKIVVTARRVGDRLELRVRDDGAGVPPSPTATTSTGVGLKNTRARLEHLYGAAHRFDVRAPAGGGFEVILEIPWRVEGGQEA